MKNISIVIFVLMLYGSSVFASNKTDNTKTNTSNVDQTAQDYSISGKLCLNINGALGATFPWGELKNINSPEVEPDLTYSIGVKSWYGITRCFAVLGGVGYSCRPITVHYKTTGDKYTFQLDSIDLLAGGRGVYKNFYGEAGLFAGITPGDPKVNGNGSTLSFKKSYPDGKIQNDYGCFVGAGYVVPISDRISLDLGMQCRFGLVYVIAIGSDKLGSTEVMVNVGINYYL